MDMESFRDYDAETFRAGIDSVHPSQRAAARSLGFSNLQTLRLVVLPQAMPSIIPASGNMLIGMLKATSLVSVIAVQDLLGAAELIYNDNFQVIPLLLVATLWYLVLTSVLSAGQFLLERHFSRGRRSTSGGFGALWRATLRPFSYRRSFTEPAS